MAVLVMVFSAAILVFCLVVFAQRLGRSPGATRPRHAGDGGGELGWLSAISDSGSDCGGGDAGGCDGGGGGD